MERIACKVCGGTTVKKGNYYVCEYCGNMWRDDAEKDLSAVRTANAWEALKQCEFEKAAALFEELVLATPEDHECLWGLALAKNEIYYVVDLNEHKKVPTFVKIPEDSFSSCKEVKAAIANAPAEVAESYRNLSALIDKIRLEWLEKASKEKPYDVFICYKDSDKEKGIARTQDSIDAQDLYNALVEEGYRVFFSRVSLRDKVAEQYEPYIYNAIETAKVMIVFGEKAEYINSTWLKNEWARFKGRIEKGKKHKNSLVVVYKDLNVDDLPVVLKSRQCLNMASISFLPDLLKHIKKVIESSEQTPQLEKIVIKSEKITKKTTTLAGNTIQVKELAQVGGNEMTLGERQKLELVQTFLSAKKWEDASSLCNDILFDNPTCGEAVWYGILSSLKVRNNAEFASLTNLMGFENYDLFEKTLNCSTIEFAATVLDCLYSSRTSDTYYQMILSKILPFKYPNRQAQIDKAFEKAINKKMKASFDELLSTIQSHEVDKYICLNMKMAESLFSKNSLKYLKSVLSVDEGNVNAYLLTVRIKLSNNYKFDNIKSDFENLVRYSQKADKTLLDLLNWMISDLKNCSTVFDNAEMIMRYFSGKDEQLTDIVLSLGELALYAKNFEKAEKYFKMAVNTTPESQRAYRGLLFASVKAFNEETSVQSELLLKKSPYYIIYLSLVDETQRKKYINLSTQQEDRLKNIRNEKIASLNDSIKQLKDLNDKDKKSIKEISPTTTFSTIFLGCVVVVAIIALVFGYVYEQNNVIMFAANALIFGGLAFLGLISQTEKTKKTNAQIMSKLENNNKTIQELQQQLQGLENTNHF